MYPISPITPSTSQNEFNLQAKEASLVLDHLSDSVTGLSQYIFGDETHVMDERAYSSSGSDSMSPSITSASMVSSPTFSSPEMSMLQANLRPKAKGKQIQHLCLILIQFTYTAAL
jgi:hypothetical protein